MKRQEQAASERRREYERVRSIALCSHVFSPLASLVKACSQGKSNITISTHSCFLRFVCLSSFLSSNISSNLASQEAYFGTLYNNLYTTNDVSLQSTIIIENVGKSNLPPERRKNDPHTQERRKKNLCQHFIVLSTYYNNK